MRRAVINFMPLLDTLFILLYVIGGQREEEVQDTVEHLHQEKTAVSREKDSLQARFSAMQEMLASLVAQKTQLEQQRSQLEQQTLQLHKELAKLQQVVANQEEKSRDQLITWEKKYTELSEQLRTVQSELVQVRQSLEKERIEKTALQERLQNKIENLSSQEKSWLQEKDLWQQDKKQMEDVLRQMQQELQAEKANLASQIKEKQSLKDQLVTEIEKLRTQIESMFVNKGKLEQEIASLQKEIVGYQSQLQKLEQDTGTLRKQLEEKVHLLLQKELDHKELLERLAAEEKNKRDLQQAIGQQENMLQVLKRQYAQMWENLQGRSLHKTVMKAQILSGNFTCYEIYLSKDKIVIRTPAQQEFPVDLNKNTSQKDITELFEAALPMAVRYDAQRTIFLFMIEPNTTMLQYRDWIEKELKTIKVLYEVQYVP
jgi:chromosome segregation ATPase